MGNDPRTAEDPPGTHKNFLLQKAVGIAHKFPLNVQSQDIMGETSSWQTPGITPDLSRESLGKDPESFLSSPGGIMGDSAFRKTQNSPLFSNTCTDLMRTADS